MSADAKAEFTRVVLEAIELPAWARDSIQSASGVEAKVLEQSYLDFLDEMIARGPRGSEWTEALMKRRTVLSSYCGKRLVSGFVNRLGEHLFVKIDPAGQKVLYWEVWPFSNDPFAGDAELK